MGQVINMDKPNSGWPVYIVASRNMSPPLPF
ncbi:uncharacterized protein G2W53_043191 [Senna tora]|uniref:Uncharacterized protein n=1 Tax=Senna tora TaxID=362788 RepID=A0A834W0F5_9FABA|nr:uncharacterized protein G2W53_043191 [Senna tora]